MSEIKPALTPEEWASVFDDEGCPVFMLPHNYEPDNDVKVRLCGRSRLPVAAACLHEQPFGFTREDVELLHNVVSAVWASMLSDAASEESVKLNSIADRIEALLPPVKNSP